MQSLIKKNFGNFISSSLKLKKYFSPYDWNKNISKFPIKILSENIYIFNFNSWNETRSLSIIGVDKPIVSKNLFMLSFRSLHAFWLSWLNTDHLVEISCLTAERLWATQALARKLQGSDRNINKVFTGEIVGNISVFMKWWITVREVCNLITH